MKFCGHCKTKQDESCFANFKRSKDGLSSICRKCKKEYDRTYRLENIIIIKQKKQIIYQINKEEIQKKRQTNKEYRRIIKRSYDAKRKKEDISYRFVCNLRNRLLRAIKNNYKSGSAVRDLGCPIENFKIWIEQQFQLGMSWNNYGKGEGKWNIDHIIPLSAVDLADRKQFLKVNHWFNLRPMWAKENISRGNRI